MMYPTDRFAGILYSTVLVLIFSVISTPVYSSQQTEADPHKDSRFLIIHLDGVSSEVFLEMKMKGLLPNLDAFFDDPNIIDHAITYFPSKTPTVITSIREGLIPEEVQVPGWQYRTRDPHTITRMPGSFLRMALSTTRISVTNLFYGISGFHWMAGIALQNAADFLDDYPLVQFYWFPTDTQGHFNGEEAYRNEIQRFDRQFGKMLKRLDTTRLNIIIYSDHGIAFGNGNRPDSDIETIIGEDLDYFSYPAIFLKDDAEPSEIARPLLNGTELDFVFYNSGDDEVTGVHRLGTIKFLSREGKIRYEYTENDILGYTEAGYKGGYLTRDEWLKLTYSGNYPGAPVNIVSYLNNPRAGEMVVLFDEGKYYQTGYSRQGNHGGFINHEMSVPLLIKGPDVTSFEEREYYWIPDLFKEIDELDFNAHPERERHAFRSAFNLRNGSSLTELEISPTYRVSYGLTLYNDGSLPVMKNNFTAWGKIDLYKSYITRIWIGAGVAAKQDRNVPLFLFQHDLKYRRWNLETRLFTTQKVTFTAGYQITDWLRVESANLNSIGIRLTL